LLKGSFSTNPDNSYELIAPASAAFTFGPGTEIAGKVRRTTLPNGIPVLFNQGNMSVTIKGGIAPATLLVNMVPGANPAWSGREVKRYFRFSPTGGSNYTADITFPYNVTELNSNSEANLVGWYNDGTSNWKQKLTGNNVNTTAHFVASAGIKANLLENQEWKLGEMEYDSRNTNFFVYPIPAKNSLNILLSAEKNKTVTIELVDVSGRVCKTLQKEIDKGLNKIAMNITTLSAGQYILKVAEGKSVQTKAVLID